MALVDDLKTRRDAIGVELAALSASAAGGKPNAAGPNAVDHVGYKDGLYRELREIQETLLELGGLTADEVGAFEVISEARI